MNLQSEDGEGSREIFSCRIESSKILSDILTCLSGNDKDSVCQIEAGLDALIFQVSGKGKTCQARAILRPEIFEEYICENFTSDDPMKFSLNLSILMDCLTLFGPSAENITATMTYSSSDGFFKVSLEESGVLTTCDITCLVPEENHYGDETLSMFSIFREYSENCRLIIKAEPLREAAYELFDVVGGGDVGLCVTPVGAASANGIFQLTVQGSSDVLELELPQSSDAFILFECTQRTKFSYSNSSLNMCLKALGISKETYIRINCEGMLSVQHQIKELSRGHDLYVDYLILAVENSFS